jgi:hypothetical protein
MNMAAPTIRAMVRKWGLAAPEEGIVPFRPEAACVQGLDLAVIPEPFRAFRPAVIKAA